MEVINLMGGKILNKLNEFCDQLQAAVTEIQNQVNEQERRIMELEEAVKNLKT